MENSHTYLSTRGIPISSMHSLAFASRQWFVYPNISAGILYSNKFGNVVFHFSLFQDHVHNGFR